MSYLYTVLTALTLVLTPAHSSRPASARAVKSSSGTGSIWYQYKGRWDDEQKNEWFCFVFKNGRLSNSYLVYDYRSQKLGRPPVVYLRLKPVVDRNTVWIRTLDKQTSKTNLRLFGQFYTDPDKTHPGPIGSSIMSITSDSSQRDYSRKRAPASIYRTKWTEDDPDGEINRLLKKFTPNTEALQKELDDESRRLRSEAE